MPRKPPSWTWNSPLKHNREDNNGDDCSHVKHCPYIMFDGTRCNKPGCLSIWKSHKYTRLLGKPMVWYRVMHSHYLVGSYAQNRNTSHIIEGTQRPAKENEIIRTWRVRNDIKFPKYLIEDFERF